VGCTDDGNPPGFGSSQRCLIFRVSYDESRQGRQQREDQKESHSGGIHVDNKEGSARRDDLVKEVNQTDFLKIS
jgi:hypothetical protein